MAALQSFSDGPNVLRGFQPLGLPTVSEQLLPCWVCVPWTLPTLLQVYMQCFHKKKLHMPVVLLLASTSYYLL